MAGPPPVLPQSVPRDVQLTVGGRVLATFATLVLLAGVGGGAAIYAQSRQLALRNHALVEEGTTTTGHVTKLWSDGDNRRRVAYRFSVEGRTFDNRARVSEAVRRTLQPGSAVTVRYLPAAPAINDLGGTPTAPVPLAVSFLLGGLGTIVGLLCMTALVRERRLLTEGWVTRGTVTSVTKHTGVHGSTHRSMGYEFTLLSGVKVSGKSEASSKGPAMGAPIWVVYDPDVPSRNRAYPFSLVKPRP